MGYISVPLVKTVGSLYWRSVNFARNVWVIRLSRMWVLDATYGRAIQFTRSSHKTNPIFDTCGISFTFNWRPKSRSAANCFGLQVKPLPQTRGTCLPDHLLSVKEDMRRLCTLGTVLLKIVHSQLKSMELIVCCSAGCPIATNFCTCHDSTAVVVCEQFCSNRYMKFTRE